MSTENTTPDTPTAGFVQTPPDAAAEPSPTYTPEVPQIRRIKRGRHPEVTRGAFGNGRKHNGVKFRTSSLIRRFV
jgi:hypothetical protein